MKKARILYIIYSLACAIIANSFMLLTRQWLLVFLFIPLFVFINTFAGIFALKTERKRLKICFHGSVLLIAFEFSALISIIYHTILAFYTLPENLLAFFWSALICILIEAILFWNGIICVYTASSQLGIKLRVIGIICGFIPIANLVVLNFILKKTIKEVAFECKKEEIKLQRQDKKLCQTKYPILMVHGVFFRDTKYFNYWGRIPAELEANGAKIYYGNHPSAASVADCAQALTKRIKVITEEFGCEKVNIIAHSKGGLDCRYALAKSGAAPYVASLTTINTPHRGCLFADYLLTKIPDTIKNRVASAYNKTLNKLGEPDADFIAAVTNLTASFCEKLDKELTAPPTVFCQSVGSVMYKASGGKFPLNFSYHLVNHFDGANDGLVSEKSFKWGDNYTLLTPRGNRGISHGDMIDLNRENIDDFDVREFYVNLVNDLKNRGL